jgi:hypothetical protein
MQIIFTEKLAKTNIVEYSSQECDTEISPLPVNDLMSLIFTTFEEEEIYLV